MKKKRIGKYIIVGTFMILTGVVGVSAANTLTSNGVLYSNAVSSVTTVEGALNELYANYNSLLAKGNASASDILSGKTALVGGKEITGTMTNIDRSIVEKQYLWTGTQLNEHNTWLVSWIPSAYYSGWQTSNGKMYAETYIRQSDLTSSIGLTSDKLLKGQTVAGVSGTATSDATANASQILSGKTAYVNGNKVTGTMPNRSCVAGGASGVIGLNKTNYIGVAVSPFDGALHWTENTDGVTRLSLQVPHGVYGGASNPSGLCGDGYVGVPVSIFGNAQSNQVLSGTTFTSQNGLNITGTIPSLTAAYGDQANAIGYAGGTYSGNSTPYVYLQVPTNTYTGSINWIRTEASNLGITADKIAAGQTIAGVTGTHKSSYTYTGTSTNDTSNASSNPYYIEHRMTLTPGTYLVGVIVTSGTPTHSFIQNKGGTYTESWYQKSSDLKFNVSLVSVTETAIINAAVSDTAGRGLSIRAFWLQI